MTWKGEGEPLNVDETKSLADDRFRARRRSARPRRTGSG